MTQTPDFGSFGRYHEVPTGEMPAEMKDAYDTTMRLRGQYLARIRSGYPIQPCRRRSCRSVRTTRRARRSVALHSAVQAVGNKSPCSGWLGTTGTPSPGAHRPRDVRPAGVCIAPPRPSIARSECAAPSSSSAVTDRLDQ